MKVQFNKVLTYELATFYDEGGLIAASFYELAGQHDLSDEVNRFLSLMKESEEEESLEISAVISSYNLGSASSIAAIEKSKESYSPNFYGEVQHHLDHVASNGTITYRELAERSGRPKAHRAAARACAINNLPFWRPCHRIIRSDGSLGGYLYGLDIKRALIGHEAAVISTMSSL